MTALDPIQGALTIRDAETGRPLTFRVAGEQVKGIAAGETVLVKYRREEGGGLTAVSVRPF